MKIPTPVAVLVVVLVLLGCTVVGYFQYERVLAGGTVEGSENHQELFSPYHTEEGWTVQQVAQFVSDLAALSHGWATSPVEAKLVPGQQGASQYALSQGKVAEKISLEPGVWNPASYASWAGVLFEGAKPASEVGTAGDLVGKLLTPTLEVLLEQNSSISQMLQAHPNSSFGHIDAALLLGTIGLNDYAGCFRDTRPVLNRMVAHLAVADALGARQDWPTRQLAEAIRLTLCGQEADALKLMEQWTGPEWQAPGFQGWTSLLRMRNTDDWRDQQAIAKAGPEALRYEYFRALVDVTNAEKAREFLENAGISPKAAYYRIANQGSLSISNGHHFTLPWLKAEIEQAVKAGASFGVPPSSDRMAWLKQYLDIPEGSPVLLNAEGKPVVQVAGLNLFASYHQRHLMDALVKTYAFLQDRWGVPDQARELKSFVADKMPKLRYTPFLDRWMARKPGEYEQTNEACIALLKEQPQIVGPALWHGLTENEDGQKLSLSVPDFHPWFRPEVPQGTAYEVNDRLYQIGVGDENDANWIAELRKRAPYSYSLGRHAIYVENGSLDNAPSGLIVEELGDLASYEYRPMRMLAYSYKGNPVQYEEWMNKLAELDSDAYIMLAEYFVQRKMDEKAAKYFLIAFEKATDRVCVANTSRWIVRYLAEKGDKEMAMKIAKHAAEVYSYGGLETYGWLMEYEGRWDEALETARKIDERYSQGGPSAELACLIRQRLAAPQLAESDRYREALANVFPEGLPKADMSMFSAAPKRGVLVNGNSGSMKAFGLRNKNVIVALNGYRTDTFAQYSVVRDISYDTHLKMIVWNGKEYREMEGDVPRKKFGVDMVDYRAD